MNFVTLTLLQATTIVADTNKRPQYTSMADNELQVLENKIDELIALCDQLNRENHALKADNASWQGERQDLMDKNELARTRVEAMINRLRTTE
jgi:cell division protein ZapB